MLLRKRKILKQMNQTSPYLQQRHSRISSHLLIGSDIRGKIPKKNPITFSNLTSTLQSGNSTSKISRNLSWEMKLNEKKSLKF